MSRGDNWRCSVEEICKKERKQSDTGSYLDTDPVVSHVVVVVVVVLRVFWPDMYKLVFYMVQTLPLVPGNSTTP